MRKCLVCKGTGKQTIQSSVLDFDYDLKKWVEKPEPPVKIKCVWCNGKGVMTTAQVEQITEYRDAWCKCKEKNGVTFFDDNERDDITKHHYRCKKCSKVTQIG
jgi:hypothetical protein